MRELIADALPWTIGLLGTTTLLSFGIGTLLGALLAWPRAPRWMAWLMPPLWALHAIPFFLLGLILIYLWPSSCRCCRSSAATLPAPSRRLRWRFVWDVFQHALLPALSIILVAIGGWALGMRGMMVTTMGEDYVIFAEAKGLRAPTIFMRYCVRNAILPQVTALALALGQILSGAVLVEVIFGYPGIGTLLYPGDPRERPFRHPGHRLHGHRRARLRDLCARRDLPLARPPHLLSPGLMRRRLLRYHRAATRRWRSASRCSAVCSRPVRRHRPSRWWIPRTPGRCRRRRCGRPPAEYPFGTDRQGRDLLAVMVAGTPLTLRIGFIAGFLGVGIGTVLAFVGAYYRGLIDTIIRGIADIGLTVPGLLVLIIIAVSIKGTLTVNQMAIVVASLAWLYPTRTIRAQVLSLRERGYVEVARLSGMSGPEHHLLRADAEPAALPGRDAGQRGLRGDPRLDRPRSARASARSTRRPSA